MLRWYGLYYDHVHVTLGLKYNTMNAFTAKLFLNKVSAKNIDSIDLKGHCKMSLCNYPHLFPLIKGNHTFYAICRDIVLNLTQLQDREMMELMESQYSLQLLN